MSCPRTSLFSARLIAFAIVALSLAACDQQSSRTTGGMSANSGQKQLEPVGGAREAEDSAEGAAAAPGTARLADEDMVADAPTDRVATSEIHQQSQLQPAPIAQDKPEPAAPAGQPTPKTEAPKSKPAKPAAKGQKTYVVQRGDSLWKIAQKQYGDGRSWRRIYNANRGKINDPRDVPVGTKLVIP